MISLRHSGNIFLPEHFIFLVMEIVGCESGMGLVLVWRVFDGVLCRDP